MAYRFRPIHEVVRTVPVAHAADDFEFIRKRVRRNRVLEACQRAGLTSGAIPREILESAGFSETEINNIPSNQRTLPLNDTDLLT